MTFFAMVLALAGGTAVSTSDRAWSAAAAALADPLSVLERRSPGARGEGALAQTKPLRTAALEQPGAPSFVPSERVLPLERLRPASPASGGAIPPDFADTAGLPGGFIGDSPGGPVTDGVPGGGPIIGGIPSSPGGGGGGFLPGSGGGGTIIPPVANVPEPASWAMMIVGLGLIGGALRRRRDQQARALSSS